MILMKFSYRCLNYIGVAELILTRSSQSRVQLTRQMQKARLEKKPHQYPPPIQKTLIMYPRCPHGLRRQGRRDRRLLRRSQTPVSRSIKITYAVLT